MGMKPTYLHTLALIFTISLFACSSIEQPEPAPLILATEPEASPTPSATIDWFPATNTPTATIILQTSPTPETQPGLGSVTFSDDFTSPVDWSLARPAGDGTNSIIVDRNRLTLAINFTPANLSSLRKGLILSNFYAETTASVNRCEGTDTYGLLLRAAGDYDSYRFILNCRGETRIERMRGGVVYPLNEWVVSGDAPPGAPGDVTLGVWASGTELRFFLNGHYQFGVFDPVFSSGTLGLFANSDSPFGMNISFSKMIVRDVAYVSPTPTSTASKTPLPSRTPRP